MGCVGPVTLKRPCRGVHSLTFFPITSTWYGQLVAASSAQVLPSAMQGSAQLSSSFVTAKCLLTRLSTRALQSALLTVLSSCCLQRLAGSRNTSKVPSRTSGKHVLTSGIKGYRSCRMSRAILHLYRSCKARFAGFPNTVSYQPMHQLSTADHACGGLMGAAVSQRLPVPAGASVVAVRTACTSSSTQPQTEAHGPAGRLGAFRGTSTRPWRRTVRVVNRRVKTKAAEGLKQSLLTACSLQSDAIKIDRQEW